MQTPSHPFTPIELISLDLTDEKVLVQPTVIRAQEAELLTDDFRMILHTHRAARVEACLRDLRAWLADAIGSKIYQKDHADLLLVRSSAAGGIWICAIRRLGDSWRADAVDVQRPRRLDTCFAISGTGEQEQNLFASYESFHQLFREWAQYADPEAKAALLRVKVDPDELWFLQFPLGLFAQMKLRGFRYHEGCQWIVTHRTISATVAAQRAAEREMADTRTFLKGAHIVINTYAAHQRTRVAEALNRGTELVLEILTQFTSLDFGEHTAGLRWTLNPPVGVLAEILRSSETRFLFADFEAAGNVWHAGDGPHLCPRPCQHAASHPGGSTFDLRPFRDSLSHIVLMRIYHCNSVYDPYRPAIEPAGERTLAGQLLATGAAFVEGSLSAEPVLDFVFELLNLLLGRSDLRTILWGRSIAGFCDLADFLKRANALLVARGYPSLADE